MAAQTHPPNPTLSSFIPKQLLSGTPRGTFPTGPSSVSHTFSHTGGGKRGSGAGATPAGPRRPLSAKPETSAAAQRVWDGRRRRAVGGPRLGARLAPISVPIQCPFSAHSVPIPLPSLTSMAPGRSRRGPARGALRRVPAVALAPAQRPPHPARPRPLASARGARPIRARAPASRLPAQRERLRWPRGGSGPQGEGAGPGLAPPAGAQPMGKELARASRQ